MIDGDRCNDSHVDGDQGSVVEDLRPHGVLTSYYSEAEQRGHFVRALFDRTAPAYDRIDRLFSFGTGEAYRRRTLRRAGLAPGMTVLDIAVGTGLVVAAAREIVGEGGTVVGLDLSAGMLRMARRKLDIPLVQGRMEALPIRSESVDCVTIGYALRHVEDLRAGFREFARVLVPGGTIVLLEFGRPVSAVGRLLVDPYLRVVFPRLCRWITGRHGSETLMRYCWETVRQCQPEERILDAMASAGFVGGRCEREFEILRTYRGTSRGHKAAAPDVAGKISRQG
jgi:demethylmenaquinone methyltransferase/2-methoxy-6-polyprenyl-1,4-benzoquinol methylase